MLLFWNPGCGFCRSLHEDLLAWEASPPEGAPALVVVSAGDAVGVKAEGFASRCSSIRSGPFRARSARTERRWPYSSRPTAASPRRSCPAAPAVLELLGAEDRGGR